MEKDTSLRDFVLGLLFFLGGIYIIFQKTRVSATWGFYIGEYHISSGMVIIPFLIGIVWKVIDSQSKMAVVLMGLGLLCILLTIMMGTRIYFVTSSLFDFVLMFSLTAIGLGLLMKSLFFSIPVRK